VALTEVGAGDFITAETMNYVIQRAVNRPTCKLALIANQAIGTGSNTAITFAVGTEIYDDLNWHSTSVNTSRVTPTYAGRYLVTAQVSWPAAASSNRRPMILKNGGFTSVWNTITTAAEVTMTVTDEIELNGTTDYVNLSVFQDSGGSVNAQGAGDTIRATSITVTYLGESL
jgi:hypothetical protein